MLAQPDLSRCPGIENHIGILIEARPLASGNNRVWHLTGDIGQAILKFYGAEDDPDAAARYRREIAWLSHANWMRKPRLLAHWPEIFACLQSVEGEVAETDRERILRGSQTVLETLYASIGDRVTETLPEARDNALIPSNLVKQLQRRLAGFDGIDDAAFQAVWQQNLVPIAQGLLDQAKDWQRQEIPATWQIASPSDMGGQNMRRDQNGGGVVLVDFEFAGRDDPAILLLDVLLHEYMRWTPVEKFRLLDGVAPLYERAPDCVARLFRYWPMVQLFWILIALNPWRDAHSSRMLAAGRENLDRLRQERLERANHLLRNFERERALSGELIANIF